jgi:hypothetical protein
MKTLLLTLALAVPLAALRDTRSVGQDPAQDHAEEAHEDSPLAEAMESIEQELGALRRAIRDEATYPDALAALARMQAATLTAKLLEPPMAADVPDADRAAFLRDYRKMMIDMLAMQLACETALLDGDAEAVTAGFKELRGFEDAGHERFTKE